MNKENENKNKVSVPEGMTHNGLKVLGVIGGKHIGEEVSSYKVVLEDGTQADIPAEQFNQ